MPRQAAGFAGRPYLWMDPRGKFLVFIAACFVPLRGVPRPVEALFFAFVCLLLVNGRQIALAAKMLAAFAGMLLLDVTVAPLINGAAGVLFLTVTRVARIFFPVTMSCILIIRTTTVSEFVAAFQKLRVSDKIIIPFSVMFRFIPTVKEEWDAIKSAMRFRGIGISARTVLTRPMLTLEYTMVPLLMSATKITDELCAASLSRGLEAGRKRTCITRLAFGPVDWLITLICAGFLVYVLVQ